MKLEVDRFRYCNNIDIEMLPHQFKNLIMLLEEHKNDDYILCEEVENNVHIESCKYCNYNCVILEEFLVNEEGEYYGVKYGYARTELCDLLEDMILVYERLLGQLQDAFDSMKQKLEDFKKREEA